MVDPSPPAGNDSLYTFIKGGTGDDTNIQLQLLDQHHRTEWGTNWCGPTAVGISLGWFAETATGDNANHANLIPHVGPTITTPDKYNAIAKLGELMGTTSGGGTTDFGLVDGIESYINSVGLTGDFKIKVFNFFSFRSFTNELQTGDEDVLVGLTSGDGSGHWLVGRSFSDVVNDNGTPDTGDDYWPVSFVDPGTAGVYHTKVRVRERAVWFKGEWLRPDIMVSVSPTDTPPNPDTAEYFVAQNRFNAGRQTGIVTGDLVFTLLGDPTTGDPRTLPLTGDANGRVFLARLTFEAVNPGRAEIRFVNPLNDGGPTIKLVQINTNGDSVLIPDVQFSDPAAVIFVSANLLELKVRMQGPLRLDPVGYEMPLDVFLFCARTGEYQRGRAGRHSGVYSQM